MATFRRFPEHFVGRVEELAAIDRAIENLGRGQAAALEIVGEPGIGKTRLLSELAARADERGHVVLSGSASELEQDLPFGVFEDAIDEYVRGLDPARLAALDDQTRRELAQMLPSFADPAGRPAAVLETERHRSHRAVRTLLEVLAQPRPLALVLDDMHWVDPGSAELLGALVRRLPAAPVLLVLATRPRRANVRLATALERGARMGVLERIALGGLSLGETKELLADAGNGALTHELHEMSGGNPFYLEQLLRSVNDSHDTDPAGPIAIGGVELPSPVAIAITEELSLLPAEARRVLEGAAVVGDPFEPELAAAAADVTEEMAIEAIDQLEQLDLVRTTDVPRRFRFRHPLVRRAVYDLTSSGWRLASHERTFAALTDRGASAVARAYHAEASGRVGDPAVVALLREAGETLASRSPEGAARWFAASLRLLPEVGSDTERVGILTSLAAAHAATGRFLPALDALRDAAAVTPPDDVIGHTRLAVECAVLEQLLGRHAEARVRLEGALRRLDDSASREAVILMVRLAMDSFYRPGNDDWRDRMRQALGLAEELTDPPRVALVLSVTAVLHAFASETDGLGFADRAAAMVDSMADDEIVTQLDALVYLAAAEAYLERFDQGIAHARRALALARATSQTALLPILVPALFTALWMRGRLAEALDVLEDAIESARLAGNDQTLALYIADLAGTTAWMGDLERARAAAEESRELADNLEDTVIGMFVGVCMGATLLECGDHAAAADAMIARCGGPALAGVPGVWRALYLDWLTRCLLALGRRNDAARAAADAETVADTTALTLGRAWADRAQARILLDGGDAEAAAQRALASVAAAEGVKARFEAAIGRIVAGQALAAAGARDQAVSELGLAAEILDACGAVRYRDQAEHELRRLGQGRARTPRGRSTGAGVASLTDRELQVAHLVVDRKTNPEIAAELVLSLKTVETHLRHIFGKLGVTSRVEVARAIEAADRERATTPVGRVD